MKAKNTKYYIYHIPNLKWGCTNNLEKRFRYTKYKLEDVTEVITCDDLDIAADTEEYLNKKFNYKCQSTNYRNVLNGAASAGGKVGGKTQGNRNKISGLIYTITTKEGQSEGGITQSQNIHICPHCNKSGKSNAMFRHHFNNCKSLTIMTICGVKDEKHNRK
jgi:hypothetical protein